MTDILLLTPPFTQLNTPYPATAYLKGFLNTKNIASYQSDLGIEVILQIFTPQGLDKLIPQKKISEYSPNAQRIYALWECYKQSITPVILFLQGHNPTLARQIVSENYLPEASRFNDWETVQENFGWFSVHDKARYMATLYLNDIGDFITECIDENFGFSRYAEHLGRSAYHFSELHQQLQLQPSVIDQIAINIVQEYCLRYNPKLVAFSVPFPGNLYSAFRLAGYVKQHFPTIKTVMGGGFPTTELRSLSETTVFSYFDYIVLDNGELPLELLYKYLSDDSVPLKRTYALENGKVVLHNTHRGLDYSGFEVGTPDYSDLKLQQYLSVTEVANPMHSLWTDGRWNKLTLAYGCYWGKCTFCDTTLPYIKHYQPNAAVYLVDQIEKIITQTHETGFHFVDEAAPPALLKEVALEIIRRKLSITWWTNIRFEKSFTKDVCLLLKASGCVAVSGGLEVASDRLLKLIEKGVSVAQVAQVTHNFTQAAIMVHAYLMYGYPTQTVQETVDSLEMVRQLFENGCLQSGFWHQFALTAHSPIGQNPQKYNIVPQQHEATFAYNDVEYTDKTGIKHEKFSFGLRKSIYNFMYGIGFDMPLQEWFSFKIPPTTVASTYIEQCISEGTLQTYKSTTKVVWIGVMPTQTYTVKTKKGTSWSQLHLTFYNTINQQTLVFEAQQGEWLLKFLRKLTNHPLILQDIKTDFESNFPDFELFWYAKNIQQLKVFGLLHI